MLPRNCRRVADSKSNSSRRLPLVTTIRVSSGWMASTSILLVAIKIYSTPSRARTRGPANRLPSCGAMRGGWFRDGAVDADDFGGAQAAGYMECLGRDVTDDEAMMAR